MIHEPVFDAKWATISSVGPSGSKNGHIEDEIRQIVHLVLLDSSNCSFRVARMDLGSCSNNSPVGFFRNHHFFENETRTK